MKFEFDFSYPCELKLKRGKEVKEYDVVDTAIVELEEVTKEDAPIAVEWLHCNRPGNERHTRWYNGHHYMMVDTQLSAEELLGLIKTESYAQLGFNTGYFNRFIYGGKSIRLDDKRVEYYDQNRKDFALRSVLSWSKRCLIVDGRAYFRCFEPHYVASGRFTSVSVNHLSKAYNIFGHAKPHTQYHGTQPGNKYLNCFSHDQYAQATEKLDEKQDRLPAIFEVFIPEAMTFNADKAALFEAGEDLIQELNRFQPSQITPEMFRLMAEVSDVIWGGDIDNFDADALAEKLPDVMNRAKQQKPHSKWDGFKKIEEVLDRWNDREFDVTNSIGFGGLR